MRHDPDQYTTTLNSADSSVVAIACHEAGIALDRAVLRQIGPHARIGQLTVLNMMRSDAINQLMWSPRESLSQRRQPQRRTRSTAGAQSPSVPVRGGQLESYTLTERHAAVHSSVYSASSRLECDPQPACTAINMAGEKTTQRRRYLEQQPPRSVRLPFFSSLRNCDELSNGIITLDDIPRRRGSGAG